ncbi:hypothetical protein FNH05_08390 [Amycolatopsis rhizosphaerae]|uniref:Uncharacterized protein n=1 Tax=Amycolatopsis rhizosphaerae TaxID=2053003 RepID=A0A558D5S0_9PSEU|nr:hypothetical protein [Amycolatopsis rhizosphaerae]TVT56343.1 hypothetical protein FNH05_08390 [Amycolatopsis rhizosphaerae]
MAAYVTATRDLEAETRDDVNVGKALWRVLAPIGKYYDETCSLRAVLDRGCTIIAEAKVNCPPTGTLVSTAGILRGIK